MNLRLTRAAPAAALWLCTLLLPAAGLRAEVKLSPLFGDHMVLQQGIPVPIWGTADAGESVTVTVGPSKATATADGSGKWSVKLPQLTAAPGGAPLEMTVSGKDAAKLLSVKDVLVGEVWVCSGQSNMEWVVSNSNNFE